MRRFFHSIARQLVFFIVAAFLSTGLAMAGYICPQVPPPPAMQMPDGVPCPDMDKEQPVLCAQAQSGDEIALEAPTSFSVTLAAHGFVLPAPPLVIPPIIASQATADVPAPDPAPPYLQTRRLRI